MTWTANELEEGPPPPPLSSNRKFSFSFVLNLFLFQKFFSSVPTCYSCYNYHISLTVSTLLQGMYSLFRFLFLYFVIYIIIIFCLFFSAIDVSFFCDLYYFHFLSLFHLLMCLSFVLSFLFSCSVFSLSSFGSNSPRSTLTKVKTRETETDKLSTQKTLKLNQNSFYTDSNFAFQAKQ